MRTHEQVVMWRGKEDQFWHQPRDAVEAGFATYMGGFGQAGAGRDKLASHSPGALFKSNLTASNLRALLPGVKVLVITRDPVARAVSQWRYAWPSLDPRSFHREVLAQIESFNDCVNAHGVSAPCVYVKEDPYNRKRLVRIGLYGFYLDELLRFIDARDVCITSIERMRRNFTDAMFRVERCLGLSHQQWNDTDAYEQNRTPGQKAARALPETVDVLRRFYAPFNQGFRRALRAHGWI